MTRNNWPSAFICGSHICKVQPSEFDSINVGPLWRPSTETLSRHPSASIIGMFFYPCHAGARPAHPFKKESIQDDGLHGSSPATTSERLFRIERSEQPIDQRLRGALISHWLQQSCD